MKTITPISIQAKNKSIVTSINHAINNATINGTIVKFLVSSVETLVYPNDNYKKILHHVRIQETLNKIKMLESKIA